MEFFYLLVRMLPAMIANMMPVVAAKTNIFPKLAFSIDGGKTLRGKRLFGDHKTVRGFIVGIFSGSIVALLLYNITPGSLLWSSWHTAVWWGLLVSTGALVGDALKSFFKRRVGIKSGNPFIPFDQIDYMLGAIALSSVFFSWSVPDIIFLLVFALIANPLINLAAYGLKIKKTYY